MRPVLLHIYPTFAVGGAQARFSAVANHFGRRWRHEIVAMDGNTDCRERLDPGLDVGFPQIDICKGDTLGNLRRFRGVLRQMRPQTLVTSNWGSIEWALANAMFPLVRHVHVEDGFGPEERSTQLRRRVLTRRLALRRCLTVLPSRKLLAIATDIWRLPASALRYVPNGVDLARFSPSQAAPHSPPVIGTVAALRAEKNLARLLHAFHHATRETPARLLIAGDGPGRAGLEALVASLGLGDSVTFAGHQPDPARAYARFDIFALSSDTEQMPLSVLEAMACGLPIASTDVGDVGAMLPVESQPYLAVLDDVSLGAKLLTLLRDPALCRRVGAANRTHAERHFAQSEMFSHYEALFEGHSPQQDMTQWKR